MTWCDVKKFFENLTFDSCGFYRFSRLSEYSFRKVESKDNLIIDIFCGNDLVFSILFKCADSVCFSNVDIICYDFMLNGTIYTAKMDEDISDVFHNSSYILDRLLESVIECYF